MIRFSDINRIGTSDYRPYFQRHHLIPLQVSSIGRLSRTLHHAHSGSFGFNDFRTNGILLPCEEKWAVATGFPLHRGPHREYNELVIERLSRFFALSKKIKGSRDQRTFVRDRVALLQNGLRRGLTHQGFDKLRLNKRDPVRSHSDFQKLDDKIDTLFSETTKSTALAYAN
ncbi:AHH domain-containing protein [Parasphingorhabdus halotolerans]|uniref:A nuclease family of the HNH/ENDO VII superfamily with conserved AHH n=1 Tax=Parasphingorhabdus halotolerans TaxID=2725558 RepID=A0A6H2DL40_9SPHN|nr:AHH domain-containing protein [Parasphingorhabdus halotolerans]QJB69379.1 hypothetical protein HF685_08875 [Parasphingorhabdus halotolerans]